MKKLFAIPDPEYDRRCLKRSRVANDDYGMDITWEESGQFWTPPVVWDDALRLKIRILYEKFKLWFYPDGWNRLFGISSRPSDLIKSTKAIWGRKLRRDISDDEARGIIRSFSNFLSLMREANAK